MIERFLSDFFENHWQEILSLTWRLFPIVLSSEFLARLFMAWWRVKNPNYPVRAMINLSSAIGLTFNGLSAALWSMTMVFDKGWLWYANTVPYYAGFVMAFHFYVIRRFTNKNKENKK